MSNSKSIEFRVFPSPETNDFEVRIFVDGQDLIEKYWSDMMGMDPDDVLSPDILAPQDSPYTAMVVRCNCGIAGCGNATVKISRQADKIIWDLWDSDLGIQPPETLVFERSQYLQALERAINDTSWETHDRTASRLLAPMIDHETLAANKLSFQWSSGRIKKGAFTVSLGGPEGCHQILVHTEWNKESPEEIAQKAVALIKKPPEQWMDVEWYSQQSKPPFKGKGWNK